MSSVPVWRRKPNEELDLFISSMYFARYVLDITKNEKIFKPEYSDKITNRLIKDSLDIYTFLWKANITNLHNDPDRRRELQLKALESLEDFECIWALVKITFHLTTKRDNYAITWLTEISQATKKWMTSDIKRLE